MSVPAAGLLFADTTPQGPLVKGPNQRDHIVLSGVWRIAPADDDRVNSPPSSADWALIRVPGSWWPERMRDAGIVSPSSSWKPSDSMHFAWYSREFQIPREWAGRQILLDLQRVSTESRVWVDGKPAGETQWPGGVVDITALVAPEKTARLHILVTARATGTEFEFMGIGQDTVRAATLRQRGLIGDVFLRSLPVGARVADVYVQTSTRKKELALEVELENLPTATRTIEISARAVPLQNGETVEFSAVQSEVGDGSDGLRVARAAWPWENPMLWDWRQPNLYRLEISVKGDGIEDVYHQRFGFREFWIEGRQLMLNGIPFRPRPANITDANGHPAAVEAAVALTLDRGIGLAWMWPENYQGRGRPFWQHLLADAADRQGLPLFGNLVRLNEYMRDAQFRDKWSVGRDPWRTAVQREWKRFRNHPSIVGWVLSGNIGPRHQDQNPRNIGIRGWAPDPSLTGLEDALGIMRTIDSTRPVLFGAAAYEGAIYSAMTYLNFTPLQEREEWLSHWAEHGQMPYCAIEFGTPLHSSFMRGRMGFRPSGETEPWVAEFAAIDLGPQAYRLESQRYRRQIRSKYQSGEKFSSFNFDESLETDPAFQAVQSLYIRNTFRSWRAHNAGWVGMISWHTPQFFRPDTRQADVQVAVNFKPGDIGVWPVRLPAAELARSWREEAYRQLPSGAELLAAEAPTMAFIAGGPEDHTDKTRNYRDGETVHKSIILVNDTRASQPYIARWKTVGLPTEQSGEFTGEIPAGQSLKLPFEFVTNIRGMSTTSARIELEAQLGGDKFTDSFEFDTFTAGFPVPIRGGVALWDPVGKTSKRLDKLGVAWTAWTGRPAPLVIVGREVLSREFGAPLQLEQYVSNGGRLLIMTQDPEWMRTRLGLRVSRHSLRRVWPLRADHPVMKGLNENHLAHWRGEATLVEARPEYIGPQWPTFGWRWGQRHVVSTAAIEKPHLSGWRPLLEGGFDLQYTPLMELDFGRGRVTICTLDFEDTDDPAADRLLANIIAHVANDALRPRSPGVTYVGPTEGEKFLRSLGLQFETRATLPSTGRLAIVASGAGVGTAAVDSFLRTGGRVLFLAHHKGGENYFGANIRLEKNFSGSLNPPKFTEADGLSASDLRFKTDADARLVAEGTSGVEVHADGLIATRRVGSGLAVYCQIDPTILNADNLQYFRLTRWRQTRAIVQLLANLGATFEADSRIFRPQSERISLAGEWLVRFTKEMPATTWDKKHDDPGISDLARSLASPTAKEDGFTTFTLPGNHPRFDEVTGEAVWRRTINIPQDWAGEIVAIHIPGIKSYDTVFWNGTQVGTTTKDTQREDPWNLPRRYRVPAHLVKAGPNIIVIRQFAPDINAGIHGRTEEFFLRLLSDRKRPPSFYHPDYKENHETGDEPYRYYRW